MHFLINVILNCPFLNAIVLYNENWRKFSYFLRVHLSLKSFVWGGEEGGEENFENLWKRFFC